MLNLDLRTVILLGGIMAVLLSVMMLFVRLSYPKSIKGLGYWALGPLLIGVAAFLLSARGRIPDLYSVVGGNALLLTGVLLFHFGTRIFLGLKPSYRLWLPVMAVTLPLLVWVSMIRPDFNLRVQLVCVVWVSILFANALTIWRHGPEGFSTGFTVVVLLTHASVLVLRLLATLLPYPNESLFAPTRVQTIYLTSNALIIIALVMGLVLMVAERLRTELEGFASLDSLTGALMRRVLIASCEQELERCRRHGRSMALVMMDLDHFKTVNDTYGHQMGDRVLIDFVKRVRPLLRRQDQLGRFGGEEFVALLPETSLEEAQLVAERIRTRMALPSGDLAPVTVSIGIATNQPDDLKIDTLLARADQALYRAKSEGRDRVVTA